MLFILLAVLFPASIGAPGPAQLGAESCGRVPLTQTEVLEKSR